jgi:hypothetical protein
VKVRALRGVCVGVEQHLAAGAIADLDAAQVPFLVSIGAVERVPDEPIQPIPPPEATAAVSPAAVAVPAKAGNQPTPKEK